MYWDKLSFEEINETVQRGLDENQNFKTGTILGIPGTYLDGKIFYDDATFLQQAPFLRTLVSNPNHIGCHTLNENDSEPFFAGTQRLEKEVIRICAEEIFQAEPNGYDGYIAPGGTEANIQAMWIYRNYFMEEFLANPSEIGLVYSVDSHYSMPKGANILGLRNITIDVEENSRKICVEHLEHQLDEAIDQGIKYFIVIQNMATTMFGSIDEIDQVTALFKRKKLSFKLHIDAAFGGFVAPFALQNNPMSFTNEYVSSITLDAHKMLQTPYGTGILLTRKGALNYAVTKEARYVHGGDCTIAGSRSGANAVAIWMTLAIHGSEGWKKHIDHLLERTSHVCKELEQMGVEYYRNPAVNIIAIRSHYITPELAAKYGLVPDNTLEVANWWKIVVMDHVNETILTTFLTDLKASLIAIA